MTIPPTLFKYEAFSAQALQNLKAQSIYFSSPLNFNDPYDCAIRASIKDPSSAEIEEFRSRYLNAADVSGESKLELKNLDAAQLRDKIRELSQGVIDSGREGFLATKGVTCFSESNASLLMWSHYGGRYRGFCLEFSTSANFFSDKIRPVKYVENFPKVDIAKIILRGDKDEYIDLFCTKSCHWAYEKEWRCIHEKAGTLYGYPPEALKAVYFGPDMERQSLEIICLILAAQNSRVEFWLGKRSEERFEVTFKKFTYTSYIDAKKMGLRD